MYLCVCLYVKFVPCKKWCACVGYWDIEMLHSTDKTLRQHTGCNHIIRIFSLAVRQAGYFILVMLPHLLSDSNVFKKFHLHTVNHVCWLTQLSLPIMNTVWGGRCDTTNLSVTYPHIFHALSPYCVFHFLLWLLPRATELAVNTARVRHC